MSLTPNIDYVFIPKVTLILEQITFACVVATKKYIFVVPKEGLSGHGRTINTTTYTVNSKDPISGIKEYLENKDITVKDLEDFLNQILFEDLGLSKDGYLVEVGKMAEFNIKAGFFSKGIYYKKPGDKGFTGIAISGKENAINLKNFYGK
ncbi:MAG: hypothetical protein AAB373_00685 [Patescibacteria group bacterium]